MEQYATTTPRPRGTPAIEPGQEARVGAGGSHALNDECLAERLQSRYGIPRYEAAELVVLFGEYL